MIFQKTHEGMFDHSHPKYSEKLFDCILDFDFDFTHQHKNWKQNQFFLTLMSKIYFVSNDEKRTIKQTYTPVFYSSTQELESKINLFFFC